jgi:hypothetical protein
VGDIRGAEAQVAIFEGLAGKHLAAPHETVAAESKAQGGHHPWNPTFRKGRETWGTRRLSRQRGLVRG